MLFSDFFLFFTCFATNRSKKYIKTIKIYIKIDAVDPPGSCRQPPPTPRSQWLGLWNPTTQHNPSYKNAAATAAAAAAATAAAAAAAAAAATAAAAAAAK